MKAAIQSGLWSSAATWGTITNTPTLHATTNIIITNTDKFTDVFTAPSTSDFCKGVIFYCVDDGVADWTATLQEYNGSTWSDVASASITAANRTDNFYVRFSLATPYQFTTTSAGYYRWKLRTATVSAGDAAADSGGTLIGFFNIDSRTGVPGAEGVFVIGENNTTPIVVTGDGTQSVGAGVRTNVAVIVATRNFASNAIYVGHGGIIDADTASPVDFTIDGDVAVGKNGAFFDDVTPYTNNITIKFVEDTGGDFGLRVFLGGKCRPHGTVVEANLKAKLISGVGTTADPLILDRAVDWPVGTELAITATSDNSTNYNEVEKRFVITKNSSTSYVLSATSGGAEAAFTYTHNTNAWILNVTRNIIFTTTHATNGWYAYNQSTVAGDFNLVGVRCEKTGANPGLGDKEGIKSEADTQFLGFDNSVIYNHQNYGVLLSALKDPMTFNNVFCVFGNSTLSGYAFSFQVSANNKILNDCFFVGNQRYGLNASSYNLEINRCVSNANGASSASTVGGVAMTSTAGNITFNDCEINCNRQQGLYVSAAQNIVFNNCSVGSRGNNEIDMELLPDVVDTMYFNNCGFGNNILGTAYLLLTAGSKIAFHNINNVAGAHFVYTPEGVYQSTGAGLTDTNVRTAGTKNLRLAPANTTGISWSFKVLARPGQALSVPVFIKKNTAFSTDEVTVTLQLPGESTAIDTQTATNDLETYKSITVTGEYTGTEYALATVTITAKSATAGAYIYIADIMNGTNDITNMNTFDNALPLEIMPEQVGDSVAIANAVVAAMDSDSVKLKSISGEVI